MMGEQLLGPHSHTHDLPSFPDKSSLAVVPTDPSKKIHGLLFQTQHSIQSEMNGS